MSLTERGLEEFAMGYDLHFYYIGDVFCFHYNEFVVNIYIKIPRFIVLLERETVLKTNNWEETAIYIDFQF